MAVQKGTTAIWSVDGITVAGLLAGIEQSFSRSVSPSQKEIIGDDGDKRNREGGKLRTPFGDWTVHRLEPEPLSVQVVE